ncbi:MAG: hypothetical protein COV47_02215 [Candidatus Diapherotrites archaeon CG11_big_fil_rev_8_21_14_0_20_37_9]|nr:MAG: hypothetical protein COV47_02215 [Candidatus Diapherotrites archaeon CG11_big_fil_rev_8_21_14_0_20_37_9]
MNKKERNDLIISWITISFAFAWIGTTILRPGGTGVFLSQFIIMLVAAGTGFILHELAHKYVAINYGAHAEFRAWRQGLILALALAFFTNGSFVFAAPGAVYVFGRNITVKQNAMISIAGPITNLAIVLFFGILYGMLNPTGFIEAIIVSAMYVNFFLAAFNMIPIYPLDGSKVFMWSKGIWLITTLVAASGIVLLPYYLTIFSML